MGNRDNLCQALLPARHHGLEVAGERRLKGIARGQAGIALCRLPQAIDGEGELGVERLLDPERAVIVEDSDALDQWQVVRRASPRCPLYEGENAALGRAVAPGGEWVARRLRLGGWGGGERQSRRGEPTAGQGDDVVRHWCELPGAGSGW